VSELSDPGRDRFSNLSGQTYHALGRSPLKAGKGLSLPEIALGSGDPPPGLPQICPSKTGALSNLHLLHLETCNLRLATLKKGRKGKGKA